MAKLDLKLNLDKVTKSTDTTADIVVSKSTKTKLKYEKVLNCKISQELFDLLHERAEQEGEPIGAVVRRALRFYLIK